MPKKAKPIQAVTYMDENDTDPNEIELWVEEGLTNRNWLFPEEEDLEQLLADDWTAQLHVYLLYWQYFIHYVFLCEFNQILKTNIKKNS